MHFFLVFNRCTYLSTCWIPLRCCKRGWKSFCFLFRTICAHPTERSVFKSSEVETKEVEVLASRSPLFYSICSLVKWKPYCLIYSSLKNLVGTRGHFESVVLPRWLEKLGNTTLTVLLLCGTNREGGVCLLTALCVVINDT